MGEKKLKAQSFKPLHDGTSVALHRACSGLHIKTVGPQMLKDGGNISYTVPKNHLLLEFEVFSFLQKVGETVYVPLEQLLIQFFVRVTY